MDYWQLCVLIECDRCEQVALVGVVVGSLLFGWLTDRIGRQFPLQIGAVVGLLSAFGSSIAPSYGWLLAARFFVGVSLGGIPQVYAALLHLRSSLFKSISISPQYVHWFCLDKYLKNKRANIHVF